MSKPIACPLCRAENYKDVVPTIAICKDCGHVFQKDTNTREYYHSLPCQFPSDYSDHAIRRGQYIVEFLPHEELTRIHRFLDIGCGSGGVMKAVQNFIPMSEAWGCTTETSASNILRGDIEVDTFPWQDFDFAILSHVVEHFLTPVETLRKVATYLKPDGIMYIEVPSLHWVELRRGMKVWWPEHISYFTPATLQNTLRMAGLTPIKVKESKYWRNIKVVCKKTNGPVIGIKKVDYRMVLLYHWLVKLTYFWHRTMRQLKHVGPND